MADMMEVALMALYGHANNAAYLAHPCTATLMAAGITTHNALIMQSIQALTTFGFGNEDFMIVNRLRIWLAQPAITAADCAALTIPALAHETEPILMGLAPTIVAYQANLAAAAAAAAAGGGPPPAAAGGERPFSSRLKIDIKDFKELTDDTRFNLWFRQSVITANAFDLQDVFDPAFPFAGLAGNALSDWNTKQRLVYDVLSKRMKTQLSKGIVRTHSATMDAHACLIELTQYYTTGTYGRLQLEASEQRVREYQIDATHKSIKAFIGQWTDRMRDHEELLGAAVPTAHKIQWFTAAMKRSDVMTNVIDNALIRDAHAGVNTNFQTLVELCLSMAARKDFIAASEKKLVVKQAGQTPDGSNKDNKKKTYAAAANGGASTYIPPEKWVKMSKEAKDAHIKAQQERRNKAGVKQEAKAAQQNGTNNTQAATNTFRFVEAAATQPASNTQQPASATQGATPQRGTAIRQFASNGTAGQSGQATQPASETRQIMIGNQRYDIREVRMHELHYSVSRSSVGAKSSLIDRGANGGLWGSEGRVIERSSTETVSISGIDGYTMKNVELGLCAAKIRVKNEQGDDESVIGLFSNYAIGGTGSTIHSAIQLEDNGSEVFDKAQGLGGRQLMVMNSGMVIPFVVNNGLIQLPMSDFSDLEFDTLRHVHMTSQGPWDPTKYDGTLDDAIIEDTVTRVRTESEDVDSTADTETTANVTEQVADDASANSWITIAPRKKRTPPPVLLNDESECPFVGIPSFGSRGDDGSDCSCPSLAPHSVDYSSAEGSSKSALKDDFDIELDGEDFDLDCGRFEFEYGEEAVDLFSPHDLNIHAATMESGGPNIFANIVGCPARSILPAKPDLEALRPNFAWIPKERIAATLKNTTQFYRAEERYPMRRHFRTRFPGANVNRLAEVVATDTMFSDVPALDDGIPGHGGCNMVQLYVGTESRFVAVYPMGSKAAMPKTLMQFIAECGAPLELFSDNAKEECSKEVQEILNQFMIRRHKRSEPYQQNQNPAERMIGDIERQVNICMDRLGVPAPMWLLCTEYVVALYTHLAQESLGGKSAIQHVTGHLPDISPYLMFHFWQPVLYLDERRDSHLSGTRERAGRFVGVAKDVGDHLTFLILDDATLQVLSRSVVRKLDDNQSQPSS